MRRTSQGGSKATTWGRFTRHDKQYQGYQTNRRGACPDCSEEDEQDDCYYGGNKKQNRGRASHWAFFFKQWLEQYNMDNPVNLNE
jgi:hypothetical protein